MLIQTNERIANVAAGSASGLTVFGMTIGQINEFLQAGAFVAAIISGLCAGYYYLRKAARK